MKKSAEIREKIYTYGLPLLLAPALLFYLRDSSDPQKAWASTVDSFQQGTIPEPTPTPEDELQEPIMSFTSKVEAFDADGNPTTGVVVGFAHSPADGSSLFDEDVDLTQWGLGIAPIKNSTGITQEHQFSPSNREGIIAGAQAQEYWEGLIAQAEAEGNQETADYLRNNYPPLQPLQKLTIQLDSIYRQHGESPKRVAVRLETSDDGQFTAKLEQENPSYLQQKEDGTLGVGGEDFDMVQPITTTESYIPFTSSFKVEFDVTGETPQMTITSDDEQIIVQPVINEELVSSASEKAVVVDNLDDLGIEITDQLSVARDEWYEQQLQLSQMARTADLPVEPPTSLPESDRRLALTISGSEQIKTDDIYKAIFRASSEEEFAVEATELIDTDLVEISVASNQIVIKNLSDTDHLPQIKINGVLYNPNEPHPIDQNPNQEFNNRLFAPSISNE